MYIASFLLRARWDYSYRILLLLRMMLQYFTSKESIQSCRGKTESWCIMINRVSNFYTKQYRSIDSITMMQTFSFHLSAKTGYDQIQMLIRNSLYISLDRWSVGMMSRQVIWPFSMVFQTAITSNNNKITTESLSTFTWQQTLRHHCASGTATTTAPVVFQNKILNSHCAGTLAQVFTACPLVRTMSATCMNMESAACPWTSSGLRGIIVVPWCSRRPLKHMWWFSSHFGALRVARFGFRFHLSLHLRPDWSWWRH